MRGAILGAAAMAAVLAACEGPTEGGAALSGDELRALAPAWEETAMAAVGGMAGPSFSHAGEGAAVATTVSTTFSFSHDCPAGGSTTVAGTHVVSGDREERTGSMRVDAARTDAACAFPLRRGGTLTITTTPSVVLTAEQEFGPSGPGVRTASQTGSFDWRHSSGASGSCSVDLTATWNHATRTHTLRGTFCGHTIDVTRTRGG